MSIIFIYQKRLIKKYLLAFFIVHAMSSNML